MLVISDHISLTENEVEVVAIRAQGAGGQNVNKVSSAIHLRFDITASSLPEYCKQAVLRLQDQRVNKDGVVVIKAQSHRTQEKNKQEARDRLIELIRRALVRPKKRYATKPSRTSQKKRLDKKAQRGKLKSLRSKVTV